MEIYRVCAILSVIVIYIFNHCDCKCEEYLLLLNETLVLGGRYHRLEPTNIPIHPEEFYLDSTDIDSIINKYKGCYLELQCKSSLISNCDTKHVPKDLSSHSYTPDNNGNISTAIKHKDLDITNKNNSSKKDIGDTTLNCIHNDTSLNTTITRCAYKFIENIKYDVNILYIKENLQKNHTKCVVYCDYAETACFDGNKSGNINSTSLSEITLQIDQTNTKQPIFTNDCAHFKTVNITCKLKDYDCAPNSLNTSIDNIRTEYAINVYLKTHHVQNNTRMKYANCTKNTDNGLNLECSNIEYVSFPVQNYATTEIIPGKLKTDSEDILIVHCQIKEPNYNDSTILNFRNCSFNKTISDKYVDQSHNITFILKSRDLELDDVKLAINNTAINNTAINTNTSRVRKEIKVHFITGNTNNCSQSSIFSITEGVVVVLGENKTKNINKELDILELKLSNCVYNESFVNNSLLTNQQTKLLIVLSNETINSLNLEIMKVVKIDDGYIILHCDDFDRDQNSSEFQCKFEDLRDYNFTELKTNITDTSKQKNEAKITINSSGVNGNNQTQINNNCSTDGNNTCMPYNITIQKGCNNDTKDNNTNIAITKKETNDTVSKEKAKKGQANITVEDDAGKGKNSLALGDETTEKVTLIVIASIAGASLLTLLVLRKCPFKKQYEQAPTREPPCDQEETAL